MKKKLMMNSFFKDYRMRKMNTTTLNKIKMEVNSFSQEVESHA